MLDDCWDGHHGEGSRGPTMDAEREQDVLELGVGCCGAGSVFLTADVHCVEEAGLIRLPHQRQALRDD